ncbi:MAG: hypothetical protein ACXWOL_10915 [Ktedonobacteraceae bacterium]
MYEQGRSREEKKKQLDYVILSASEESRVMGYEILRWRSEQHHLGA